MRTIVAFSLALCIPINVCLADGPMVDLRGVTNANQIVGYLGVPLGTSVSVTGTVQLDPPHPKKIQKGEFFEYISIEAINGKKLDSPVMLEIFPRGALDEEYVFKHGDKLTARVVERIMTYGMAKDDERRVLIQTRHPDYRLDAFAEILKVESQKHPQPDGGKERR